MQENRKLTKPTFDNLPTEKRLKIIRTATGEFAKNGYENTNINTIIGRHRSAWDRSTSTSTQSRTSSSLPSPRIPKCSGMSSPPSSSDLSFEEKVGALIEAIQRTSQEQEGYPALQRHSVGNTELVRSS